jgi:pyridoxine/pyridoxamine 5'-phosphate oxidase
MMSNWIDELKNNIAGEYERRPAVVTLATVNQTPSGPNADARSVVVRDLRDDGTVIITSDSRSEKNAQLRLNPSATAVFWLASQRWQCIVTGEMLILDHLSNDQRRIELWQRLSDATRAMFTWPAPGERFDATGDFTRQLDSGTLPPDAFELLLLKPLAVETLDVRAHPHRRVVWKRAGDQWESNVVNP